MSLAKKILGSGVIKLKVSATYSPSKLLILLPFQIAALLAPITGVLSKMLASTTVLF
jgi:hypothetical protein